MVFPAAVFTYADPLEPLRHFLHGNEIIQQGELLVVHIIGRRQQCVPVRWPRGLFGCGGNPEIDMLVVGADVELAMAVVHIVVMPVAARCDQLWYRAGLVQWQYVLL